MGRSMIRNTQVARYLGFMHVASNLLISPDNLKGMDPKEVVIVTTGSQGQPMSSVTRMAMGDHKQISVQSDDIRGASPESTIILGEKGPVNGPLRFPDEYVRHKVLDLIGDLALAGRRLEGHVVAMRAGHAMHTALVARLLKDRSAWELAHVPMTPPEAMSEAQPETDSGVAQAALAGA